MGEAEASGHPITNGTPAGAGTHTTTYSITPGGCAGIVLWLLGIGAIVLMAVYTLKPGALEPVPVLMSQELRVNRLAAQ